MATIPFRQKSLKEWQAPAETSVLKYAKDSPLASIMSVGAYPAAQSALGHLYNMGSAMVTPDTRTTMEKLAPVQTRTQDMANQLSTSTKAAVLAPAQIASDPLNPMSYVNSVAALAGGAHPTEKGEQFLANGYSATRPETLKPLPNHGANTWKPEEPVKNEWMGPPNLGQPQPKTSKPQALALPEFDPRQQNAINAAYSQQVSDIDSRYAKGIANLEELARQNSIPTMAGNAFGRLMANQNQLAAINGLVPQIASGHMANANHVAALPLMSNVGTAVKEGNEPRYDAHRSIFKEGLPSTKAQIEAHKAQAVGSLASAEHAKAQASALPTHTLTEATKAAIAAKKESAHPYVGELLKMLPNITDSKEYNKHAALIAKLTGGEILMPKREEK